MNDYLQEAEAILEDVKFTPTVIALYAIVCAIQI